MFLNRCTHVIIITGDAPASSQALASRPQNHRAPCCAHKHSLSETSLLIRFRRGLLASYLSFGLWLPLSFRINSIAVSTPATPNACASWLALCIQNHQTSVRMPQNETQNKPKRDLKVAEMDYKEWPKINPEIQSQKEKSDVRRSESDRKRTRFRIPSLRSQDRPQISGIPL